MDILISTYAGAVDFAAEVHQGQRTKVGDPYILHPVRVSLALRAAGFDYLHQIVGVLHDVVEDCAVPLEELGVRFGTSVAEAVDSVTKRPNARYEELISRAAAHPVGATVKFYDLRDNIGRLDELWQFPEMQERLLDRYTKALAYLEPVLAERAS